MHQTIRVQEWIVAHKN